MTSRLSRGEWRTQLQRLGDRARDRGDFVAAAELYENAMAAGKETAGLTMAAGHMRKEGKDFASAERHYLRVLELTPDDAEIHLQMGHFCKTVGRYIDAENHYSAALSRNHPNRSELLSELRNLHRSEGLRREYRRGLSGPEDAGEGLISDRLLPRPLEQIHRAYEEGFVLSRLGSRQKTPWGRGATICGVDALRGHIISRVPCQSVEIFLDHEHIHTEPLSLVTLRWERDGSDLRKYVFNAWIDFTDKPRGKHDLVFRATSQEAPRQGIEWRRETIFVADPIPEEYSKGSPALIPQLDPNSSLSVVDQVNNLPSLVRRVTPGSFPGKLETVAVMRLDQLGDMVVTVPAMRRLREILPNSRIVGLVSPANAGLANSLGVFDDVVPVNFPDDRYQHKRVMDAREQEAFIALCRDFKFDLAIDFLYSEHANKLLPLTGAPVTMTVARSDHIESLEVAFDSRSPSGGENLSPMTHTAKARAVSEALALWVDNEAKPLMRTAPCGQQLARYGLSEGDRYVVLHTGSSFAHFLRWPFYPELTERLLEAGYKVVYMAGDDGQKSRLSADAMEDGRIIYLARKMPFDDLDALLACASLMIGNDSGPKHWANLRGTPVVSIHPGRDDLREWGQVFGGVVLARRVPCAGCGIRYDETECGQDFACVKKITVEDVLREATSLTSPTAKQTEGS